MGFADCGAGIGRVSAELLLHYFQEVDLVEPSGACCIKPRMCLVDFLITTSNYVFSNVFCRTSYHDFAEKSSGLQAKDSSICS